MPQPNEPSDTLINRICGEFLRETRGVARFPMPQRPGQAADQGFGLRAARQHHLVKLAAVI
jgi:hypothetical protein